MTKPDFEKKRTLDYLNALRLKLSNLKNQILTKIASEKKIKELEEEIKKVKQLL